MVWKDDYILHELLADRPDILAQGGAEHHHLLAVWCAAEDFLYIFPHIYKGQEQHFIELGILRDNILHIIVVDMR